MNDLTGELAKLSSAEEFLVFFAVPIDQKVVNVSRLHILMRFDQYLRRDGGLSRRGRRWRYFRECRAFARQLEWRGVCGRWQR